MDFRTSNIYAWTLLRKLGAQILRDKTTNNPNTIAFHVVAESREIKHKTHTIKVKRDFRTIKAEATENECSCPFTLREVSTALGDVKPGKTQGLMLSTLNIF